MQACWGQKDAEVIWISGQMEGGPLISLSVINSSKQLVLPFYTKKKLLGWDLELLCNVEFL